MTFSTPPGDVKRLITQFESHPPPPASLLLKKSRGSSISASASLPSSSSTISPRIGIPKLKIPNSESNEVCEPTSSLSINDIKEMSSGPKTTYKVFKAGTRTFSTNPLISPRVEEKGKGSKYLDKKIKNFWKAKLEGEEEALSFNLFQEECFLYPLQGLMENVAHASTKLEKYKKPTNPINSDDALHQLAEQLKLLLAPMAQTSLYHKIEQLRPLLPLIYDLKKLKELTKHKKSQDLPTFFDESNLKLIKFLLDWNISSSFYWSEAKWESTYKIPASEIVRALSPLEANQTIAEVYLNGKYILKADTPLTKEALFTKLLLAIATEQGLGEIEVAKQVGIFLFFAQAQPEVLRSIQKALLSSPTNWDRISKIIAYQIPERIQEKFHLLKEELLKNIQKAFTEIPAFKHLSTFSTDEIFSFLDKETKEGNDLDIYVDRMKSTLRHAENALLRLLIPAYKPLQLCTVSCMGYTSDIHKTYLNALRDGSHEFLMRDTHEIIRSFHLTVGPHHYGVTIPLQYGVYPKINPDDKECHKINQSLRLFTFNFNWTITSAAENILGCLDVDILVHEEAKRESSKLLDIIKIFKEGSNKLRALARFQEESFPPLKLKYQKKPEPKLAYV
ncbi:hypothetical protein [Parachlamydia sp. AcF125]|uniref:hypothetical protein n=1 Tax=Parachlamydia sp. AcF125 TaxID=2795736 RepID=UPI001BC93945|nr:hypothetical protein [Parachlamydia sp. AcF125]MBS4168818.1 hypothetical protein [Parachlamydia sp. AcF125]